MDEVIGGGMNMASLMGYRVKDQGMPDDLGGYDKDVRARIREEHQKKKGVEAQPKHRCKYCERQMTRMGGELVCKNCGFRCDGGGKNEI